MTDRGETQTLSCSAWRTFPSVGTVATATFRRSFGYDVKLSVSLPPCFVPWVNPSTLLRPTNLNFDLADEARLNRFVAHSERIIAEQKHLVETLLRDWRLLTEDEERRFAVLTEEFEIARASFEMTLAVLQ